MCLLVLFHRVSAEAPLMLAANREEYFDRPASPPAWHTQGSTQVVSGQDLRAGGTWLGVNQFGLLVAVTNRPQSQLPPQPVSRGSLCLELLALPTADAAVELAESRLRTGRYAGVNYLIADGRQAHVACFTDQFQAVTLPPGLHLLTNGPVDDPHDMRQDLARWWLAPRYPASPEQFLQRLPKLLSIGPDPFPGKTILVRQAERGTVSSSLITLATNRSLSRWLYAPGAPDVTAYQDLSAELAQLDWQFPPTRQSTTPPNTTPTRSLKRT